MASKRQQQHEEHSTVTGYKDKLVGGVKATVGGLLGLEHMEKEGARQKQKGEAELRAAMEQQRAMGDLEREKRRKGKKRSPQELRDISNLLVKREALFCDIDRSGGFEKMRTRLHHVDLKEPNVLRLFDQRPNADKWKRFQLKRIDLKPLFEDIRERRTRRPLVHIEPQEKGLMRSIGLAKNDFKLKKIEDERNRLLSDIRRPDTITKLRRVSRNSIRDRSAPHLDLLKVLKASHQQHDQILRQISLHPRLRHVDTKDKSKPSLVFDKKTTVHRLKKDQLLEEVKKGIRPNHVETNDRSKPVLEQDLHIKTIDRRGFLDEVHRGTQLRHIA